MCRTVLLAAILSAVAGCGGNGGDSTVKVAAASSLTEAFGACDGGIPGVQVELELGGSDDLATQIRQGVGIDVFAAANMKLLEQLAAEHKAGAPVPFATNRLVLVVPRHGSPIRRFGDLVKARGTRLAVGAPSVPVGGYTQQVLDRMAPAERAVVRREIATEEPDVKGVVGKVVTGAADAGFVYFTDTTAAANQLLLIPVPARLQPTIVYGVSIVRPSARADKVVDDLLHGGCATALRHAGFGAPPR